MAHGLPRETDTVIVGKSLKDFFCVLHFGKKVMEGLIWMHVYLKATAPRP